MIVVLISADAEWGPAKNALKPSVVQSSPYGEFFDHLVSGIPVVFLHGGWGKIAAAASAEYAIARWSPTVLVNLGTCGGVEGRAERGETLLVTRTIVYDIHEAIGDSSEAVRHYSTRIDVNWLPVNAFPAARRVEMLSGDGDLVPSSVVQLSRTYPAVAADWESGAIAYVAARRNVRLLILRVVSDLVSPQIGEAVGDLALFQQRAEAAMRSLLLQFAAAVPSLLRRT